MVMMMMDGDVDGGSDDPICSFQSTHREGHDVTWASRCCRQRASWPRSCDLARLDLSDAQIADKARVHTELMSVHVQGEFLHHGEGHDVRWHRRCCRQCASWPRSRDQDGQNADRAHVHTGRVCTHAEPRFSRLPDELQRLRVVLSAAGTAP